MKILLVGADFEENLGVGQIAAVARAHGHQVQILPFNDDVGKDQIVQSATTSLPDVIGLSIQFQHRARELLTLARDLRQAQFRGHITCGGHFPSFAYREVLERGHGVDSIVLYDGEVTFPALIDALENDADLADVDGIAYRRDGIAVRTRDRPMIQDLDAQPLVLRYRPHEAHFNVPFIPILGGRGCWGRCSFCSISAFYKDAKKHGGGRLLRMRSPEQIAREMAALWHRPSIFCFHDDNFLLPRSEDSRQRYQALRDELDRLEVVRYTSPERSNTKRWKRRSAVAATRVSSPATTC